MRSTRLILSTTLLLLLNAPFSSAPLHGALLQDAAPDKTQPPADVALAVDPVIGRGVQIYHCQQQAGAPAWVLTAPEATLETVQGERVGMHGVGPVWRWKDGSAVTGAVVEKQPAPDLKSIPWLLLKASPASGSAPAGALAGVTFVRRADTQGGSAPNLGCDAGHIAAEVRVPYTATYYFYKVPGE